MFLSKSLLCILEFVRKIFLEKIKSSLRHLQFMVRQKYNLLGHLVLPRIFPVGQNIRCVLRFVGQFFILVGHCPMSDRYFKVWKVFLGKGVLKICSKFTRENPFRHGCSPVNLRHIFRALFPKNTTGGLLLEIS